MAAAAATAVAVIVVASKFKRHASVGGHSIRAVRPTAGRTLQRARAHSYYLNAAAGSAGPPPPHRPRASTLCRVGGGCHGCDQGVVSRLGPPENPKRDPRRFNIVFTDRRRRRSRFLSIPLVFFHRAKTFCFQRKY